jgi:selenocysteine lyase/cysteine desulfurase
MHGKDAVFLSPHKFAGGPGTPGVLVVKRSLLRNRVPSVPAEGRFCS